LLFSDGFSGWAVVSLRKSLVEQLKLGWLRLCNTEGAFCALDALELLPVAGHLEQCCNSLGWLSANGEPVLRTLGVDLDYGRLSLWLVDTDVLDNLAVALGACISDDNAVVRGTDLAEALELNLYSHVNFPH